MKKILMVMMVAVISASLIACSFGQSESQSTGGGGQEASALIDLSGTGESAEEYTGAVSLTTGLPVSNASYHPVVVQIDNEASGRPQYGIQAADIVYESLIEGSDTRFTALFNDTLPEKVGPVRSARVYHQKLAAEWDPIFIHQGGPYSKNYPRTYIYSEENGGVFEVRLDGTKRENDDVMWAQTISIEYCSPKAAVEEYDFERTLRDPLFTFDAKVDYSAYPDVDEVQIPFLADETDHVSYTYDAAKDKFIRYRYGEPFLDAETEEAVEVQNVIVEYCEREQMSNENGRILMHVEGSGKAEFFVGGKHLLGTWEKDGVTDATRYYLENGEELVLKPGNTWIEIQPDSKNVRTIYQDGTQYYGGKKDN